jgi:hypothetical protein
MDRLIPVARFFMEIWACGIVAPDGSVTVPETVAPTTCAYKRLQVSRTNASAKNLSRLNAPSFELFGCTIFPSEIQFLALARETRKIEAFGFVGNTVLRFSHYKFLIDSFPDSPTTPSN